MKLHADIAEERLKAVLTEFTGEIYQRPPLRSSVKRRTRTRYLYSLDLLETQGRIALFNVSCQSGTYIRKLVHDVGEVLGCGAHMSELRRTRAGPFVEDAGYTTLQSLSDAVADWKKSGEEDSLRTIVQIAERSAELLPKIVVKDSAVEALCRGAHLAVPGIARIQAGIATGELAAVMSLKGELVALGRTLMSTNAIMDAEKGVASKTDRVIMSMGTYPKMW